MIDKNPADAVRQATGRGEFEALARAGHVVSGLLHLLIAYIVVRLAFGDPGNADQSGALGLFASSTGGRMALWAAVVAFVAMALWRIAETIIGPHPANPKPGEDDGWLDRAKPHPWPWSISDLLGQQRNSRQAMDSPVAARTPG